jgi:hypothetical protein
MFDIPLNRPVLTWFVLLLICSFAPARSTTADEFSAVYYDSVSVTPGFTLRIGFWQDPDLSGDAKTTLRNRLIYLGGLLKEGLGEDLAACKFSDLEVYVLDDYQVLKDERRSGDYFDLLHCDQATYLIHGFGDSDPYDVLVEEATSERPDERGAGIWVRADSAIKSAAGKQWQDLENRHVAIVDEGCLYGGALQEARLAKDADRPVSDEAYSRTGCGSTSEAILRLITGLASEKPIEAAFLPLDSPGFKLAKRSLGLRPREDLPIRLLAEFDTDHLPGRPILAARYLLEGNPPLCRKLAAFFERQSIPWNWKSTNRARYQDLRAELRPLRDSGGRRP